MVTTIPEGSRKSDRYVTPGVLIAVILGATLILVAVTAGVAYLTAQGIDPDPMLKLVATIGTGLIATINLLVNLAGRVSQAKTERNTGVLAGNVANVVGTVYEVADRLAVHQAAAPTSQLPPVPMGGTTR